MNRKTLLSYRQHTGKDTFVSAHDQGLLDSWGNGSTGRVLTEDNGLIAVRYPSRGIWVYRRTGENTNPWRDDVEVVLIIPK